GRSREQTEGRLLQSKIVGVDGRWGENSFSSTIAQQTRIFAPANNNRPQTSLPRRNKLSESPIHKKRKSGWLLLFLGDIDLGNDAQNRYPPLATDTRKDCNRFFNKTNHWFIGQNST
ncbi:MAG: hypothetical protein IKC42_01500, partial [Alistipes sp.]|nr:hypothetical protein [Alistipes sp.]